MVQPVLWKLNLKANGISGGFNLLLMGGKNYCSLDKCYFRLVFLLSVQLLQFLGLWDVWSTCSVSLLLFQVTTLITCFVYLVCLSSRFVLVCLYSPWSACFLRGFMFAVSLMVQLLWRTTKGVCDCFMYIGVGVLDLGAVLCIKWRSFWAVLFMFLFVTAHKGSFRLWWWSSMSEAWGAATLRHREDHKRWD